ncbi:hypothetical protein [Streptomyces boninensis]|uniref:hypothetical protein n=1 Tax=Streptomyces boninensis TaxID=2039455 RepID=UPI003B218327
MPEPTPAEDTWQPPSFTVVETGLEVTGYALSDRGEHPAAPPEALSAALPDAA